MLDQESYVPTLPNSKPMNTLNSNSNWKPKHPFRIALTMILFLTLCFTAAWAQGTTQVVRGQVIDQESEMPLSGATVTVQQGSWINGAITDGEGNFRVIDVPLGRIQVQVKMSGYDLLILPDLQVNSSKEVVRTLGMVESLNESQLDDVVITATDSKREPLNEMATVSARSFSIEETNRYAAAISDPARMAQNFAGVTSSGDDMSNEIVIRGNSPRGMLWRMEGIEIPNPNHFGDMGSSGGPISMLSATTLANSDFYTGAFPAEYGNAYSGVFDLRMRKGNNENRESSFMIGVLGIEAATEGYFTKSSKASYLVNYRYSTLALMQRFIPNLDVLPAYQDLSFQLNFPTKAGTFSLFGLGGSNQAEGVAVPDSSLWETLDDGTSFASKQKMGVVGLKHKLLLGEKTYLQSVLAASADTYWDLSTYMVPERDYDREEYDKTYFENQSIRLHSLVNHKLNAKNSFRAGVILSQLGYDYVYDYRDFEEPIWTRFIDGKGNTQQLEGYAQWKHRFNERFTINMGAHATYLALNKTSAIDPRAALSWQAAPRHKLSLASGLHSKPEHISTYFLEQSDPTGVRSQPNRNLEMLRAWHLVLGHDFQLAEDFRLKTEIYYQYLFDVPIENLPGSTFSMTNARGIWGIVEAGPLVNQGTARNYGLDLTLEKFLSNGYYGMLTGSLYQSEFTAASEEWHPTRFNGNYNLSLLGGKEFKMGKEKKNVLGLNGKFLTSGGNRFTPINFTASQMAGEQIRYEDQPFADRVPAYLRMDLAFSYTLNAKATTHRFTLDLQNLTNRQNIYTQYYDDETNSMETIYQNGIFPVLNYRVEF